MRRTITGTFYSLVIAGGLYGIGLFAGITRSDFEPPDLFSHTQAPQSVARFEPSSFPVVEEMLRMGDVKKDDVVYDLGCGDGRIVITAAASTGARGVGVDIDPDLITDCRKNAEQANVGHLVQFREEDIFRTDITNATVVMLYLSPDGNIRLRPRLLSELAPGTRIISHMHDMGDWTPDKESTADGHRIYSWSIPAHVAGIWLLDVKHGSKGKSTHDYPLTIIQSFQQFDGELKTDRGDVAVIAERLEGSKLKFRIGRMPGLSISRAEFTGDVDGNRMTGTFRAGKKSGTWSAQRITSIPAPL